MAATKEDAHWQIQEAKQRFSELIRSVQSEGPQFVTKHGEEIAVVIDPGRAFGTGAHGSTRAALALLQELEPGPALDLGCGSGVLSIAAARLGFDPIQIWIVYLSGCSRAWRLAMAG